MDDFEFFFTFYGLILGLAAAEILSGIAAFVRVRRLREMELQTALLVLFTFFVICATWIDAWRIRDTFSIDIGGMLAPIVISTSYYLAAATAFPREAPDFEDLEAYYSRRKVFAVAMLLIAEIAVTATYIPVFVRSIETQPAVFWIYHVPYNLLIKGSLIALLFVHGRRANIILLSILIGLFTVPYWSAGWVGRQLAVTFGY